MRFEIAAQRLRKELVEVTDPTLIYKGTSILNKSFR
jgi:hypothetical protein